MFKKTLMLLTVLSLTNSCFEPQKIDSSSSSTPSNPTKGKTDLGNGKLLIQSSVKRAPIYAKNYLQINNTYSKITGIATDAEGIKSEYDSIIMQLPSTGNPEALNGFNQIAQARLGFAYCNKYIDKNYEDYKELTEDLVANKLLESFLDIDLQGNEAHKALKKNLVEILKDSDSLVSDNDEIRKKKKLMKMGCASLLASSYISML